MRLVPLAFLGLCSFATAQVNRERFVIIENGWAWTLLFFILAALTIAALNYLYGRLTRPGKALSYALKSVKHLFIWVAIALTIYPVVYILAASFNRNNSLAAVPPQTGSMVFRSGVLPDPANFALVHYQHILSETNLHGYQWLLLALGAAAGLAFVLLSVTFPATATWLGRLRRLSGYIMLLSVIGLVVSITPDQFYSIGPEGQHIRASTSGMMVLYIRNTLVVSGMTGLFAVFISTTAGYAFARMRFEGRYQTLLVFVFVQMFPGFMALVAIFYLMNYLGLLNTFTGLILAYSGGAIAFSSWIFKGYLESISPSLEEAAMVDGTTHWGAFWHIILPTSMPMLLFIFLLQFIGTYSEFLLANVLLTGAERWTVGLGLFALASDGLATRWGTLAASAVLGSLPILILFYTFQNALTGQYTAGGVKG
ncbi:MAG: ABC transporter permease subunit [Truepera sp.]|nr:ABC transporter permease subunit [Truepera sp.]